MRLGLRFDAAMLYFAAILNWDTASLDDSATVNAYFGALI
jgi:hypothetical protein